MEAVSTQLKNPKNEKIDFYKIILDYYNNMSKRFAQKVALVTGSSSGIGFATAKMFAKHGATVACTGRNQAALDDLVAQITSEGGQAVAIPGDITNDDDIANIVATTVQTFGKLNILVNNAGVLKGGAVGADDTTTAMATWDFNMNCNAKAPFSFMTQAIPHLKEQEQSGKV